MTMKTKLKEILNIRYTKINRVNFDKEKSIIYVHVDSTKGKKKLCPICMEKCRGYDSTTTSRLWRHLDLGDRKVVLVADVHRIECKEHGVLAQWVPWAEHKSRFTKEFEQQIVYLAQYLNKSDVARIMRISWDSVNPILSRNKNVLEVDSSVRFTNLKKLVIDETTYRMGYKFVSVIFNQETNQVVWVGKATGEEEFEKFVKLLTQEQREAIEFVCANGAKWLWKCANEWLPNADVCIDDVQVDS